MIIPHRFFRQLSDTGLSDIRVVVYNSVPLMAMLRVPTIGSGGRANLHAGGLGIGVDVGSGVTTTVIHNGQLVAVHPDTAMRLADLKVPKWRAVLEVAVETQQVSGLGYIGVDLVIDKHSRVMVLEANARPGLSIQTANMAGLNERVFRVRNLKVKSLEHGLRVSHDLFSEVGKAPHATAKTKTKTRPVVKRIENISISHPNETKIIKVKAKVDTGADSTSIGIPLARRLGYRQVLLDLEKDHVFDIMKLDKAKKVVNKLRKTEFFQTHDDAFLRIVKSANGVTIRVYLPVRLTIRGKSFNTYASVADRSTMTHQIIVGAHDLSGFYIDPTVH